MKNPESIRENLSQELQKSSIKTGIKNQSGGEIELVEEKPQKYFQIIQATADIIFITDKNGVIEFVNPAFEKVTGYTWQDAVGQNPRILKSGLVKQRDYEMLWTNILSGTVFRNIPINKKKNGEHFYYDQTVTPLTDGNGNITHFISTGRDITERVQIEEQLRQSQKMELIGKLAGGIAHDFNNLLTVIAGYIDIAMLTLGEGDPLLKDLKQIKKASMSASTLTKKLLTFSRKQKLQTEVIDLNIALKDMKGMLTPLVPKDIKLIINTANRPALVDFNLGQFEQIVMNLVVNARDAMPDGGDLSVETEIVELKCEFVASHPEAMPGSYVLIKVKDAGQGMSEEVKSQIFEPFYTTKPEGKGTGLGLFTVFGIVKQSGGFIDVDSGLGKGTTFKIFLPTAEENALKAK